MNELISVVVPVYNVAPYLEECINSLLAQTYPNIEVVLIDDGSTDGSSEICDKFASNPSIQIIHQKNQGVVVARKQGIAIAKGKWIGFVDSDDWVERNYYELLYREVSNAKADLAINRNYTVRLSGYKGNKIEAQDAKKLLCKLQFPTSMWAGLFLKEKLEKICWNKDIHFFEDFLFMYQYLSMVDKVVLCDNGGYYYRDNAGSINAQGINDKRMSCLDIIPLIDENGLLCDDSLKEERVFAIAHFIISILVFLEADMQEYCLRIKSVCKKYWKKIFLSNCVPISYKGAILICSVSVELWCELNKLKRMIKKRR